MIARFLPIVLASLVVATSALPAFGYRASGRDIDKTEAPTLTKASDRPSAAKEYDDTVYELWICKPTQGYSCEEWTLQGSYRGAEWDVMAQVFINMGYSIHRGR